jgi:hypothetical protein
MPNRSQEENLNLLLEALRNAGEKGLTVEQVKSEVFKDSNYSKTDIKKLLEHLRTKGFIHSKVGKLDVIYTLVAGR